MIDLTTYSQDEVIAKGQYSIVRGAHEQRKERLAHLCGQFASIPPEVLRLAQPKRGMPLDAAAIAHQIAHGRVLINEIEAQVAEIEGLAAQRATLKQSAWG